MESETVKFEPWECHAHPAALNGKPCGYLNTQEKKGSFDLTYCNGCGCTKHASDLRKARKEG